MKNYLLFSILLINLNAFAENGFCEGSASSCAFAGSSGASSCKDQRGCSWSNLSHTCSGIPASCDRFRTPISCSDQNGCHWTSIENENFNQIENNQEQSSYNSNAN